MLPGPYYYLMSYLPTLVFEGAPPLARERFLSICAQHIGKSHFAALSSVSLSSVSIFNEPRDNVSPSALRQWCEWDGGLRNALVGLRAAKLGLDEKTFLRPVEIRPEHEKIAKDAFGAETPLAGEILLARARWAYIEQLEFGRYFSIDNLVLYYLKLLIKERLSAFDAKSGFPRLKEIIEAKMALT